MNGYSIDVVGRRISPTNGRDCKGVYMKPRKKGQQYEISYCYPCYPEPFYERFSSYEEANLRIAQIEYEKSLGVFQPPKPVPSTVRTVRKKYTLWGN